MQDLDVAEEIKMKLKTRITEMADNLDTMDDDKVSSSGVQEQFWGSKWFYGASYLCAAFLNLGKTGLGSMIVCWQRAWSLASR
jgi:hypothetical protein